MLCEPSPGMNELDFFHHLRHRDDGRCLGPCIPLSLWPWQVTQYLAALPSRHTDLLWSGLVTDRCVGVTFQLCTAHWFDLVWDLGLSAYRQHRRDLSVLSGALLGDLCAAAGWDQKEVANLITRMGARLT